MLIRKRSSKLNIFTFDYYLLCYRAVATTSLAAVRQMFTLSLIMGLKKMR